MLLTISQLPSVYFVLPGQSLRSPLPTPRPPWCALARICPINSTSLCNSLSGCFPTGLPWRRAGWAAQNTRERLSSQYGILVPGGVGYFGGQVSLKGKTEINASSLPTPLPLPLGVCEWRCFSDSK